MPSLRLLASLSLLPLLQLPAFGDVLASYDFNSSTNRSASTDINAQTIAGNFVIGPAGTNWAFSSAQNNVFARGDTTPDSSANAISAGSYFSFTVTPNALGVGESISLSSLTFDTISNNAAGVASGNLASFFVRTSLDGFTANIGDTFSQSFNSDTTVNAQNRSVTLTGLQGITSSVEFRIYVFDNTTNVNRTPRVDNVVLNGLIVTAVVPEPASAASLAGIGMLGAAGLRRRRHR